MSIVGSSIPRKEGFNKLTGAALYVDDVLLNDFLFVTTVRSTVPRGIIQSIEFLPGVPWDEIVVVDHRDIPGDNVVALITDDQPLLAEKYVNHIEEPIMLLAHRDRDILLLAQERVRISYELLNPVFEIEDSLRCKPVIWGEDNVFREFTIKKGDVDQALQKAHRVIEGTYRTGAQEQLYIETNGMIAHYEPSKGVVVRGSLQCPFYIQTALTRALNLPNDKVRVVQMETGGGFGGKEEFPSVLACHAALVALKTQKTVKLIYDRNEDMRASTKRHPSLVTHKTALDQNGRLLAMDIDFVIDGGAYATLSSVVLSRGAIHAAGPYHCPNVRIRARAVATNAPPHGAFRGFGAPQSVFALERQMDKIASELRLEPSQLRAKNFIQKGQTTATSQIIREDPGLEDLVRLAFEKSDYCQRVLDFREYNEKCSHEKRGIGFATFMHGAGFTGSGEVKLSSEAALEVSESGRVRVLAGSTEIGQGTNTVFSQIVASVLQVEPAMIEIVRPDTHMVPDSGPTVASRTVMVVGKLLEQASFDLRNALIESGFMTKDAQGQTVVDACVQFAKTHGKRTFLRRFQPSKGTQWDDTSYKGDAYAAFAWACYVATVRVDLLSCEVFVEDFVAVQEAGKIVNPVLAEGQIEGGVAQGLGFCLLEQVRYEGGRIMNANMTNYIVPTSVDTPPIRVFFVQREGEHGPAGGAKGIGELPLDGAAPAIASAIEFATGVSVNRIPFTPEVLMRSFADRRQ